MDDCVLCTHVYMLSGNVKAISIRVIWLRQHTAIHILVIRIQYTQRDRAEPSRASEKDVLNPSVQQIGK